MLFNMLFTLNIWDWLLSNKEAVIKFFAGKKVVGCTTLSSGMANAPIFLWADIRLSLSRFCSYSRMITYFPFFMILPLLETPRNDSVFWTEKRISKIVYITRCTNRILSIVLSSWHNQYYKFRRRVSSLLDLFLNVLLIVAHIPLNILHAIQERWILFKLKT